MLPPTRPPRPRPARSLVPMPTRDRRNRVAPLTRPISSSWWHHALVYEASCLGSIPSEETDYLRPDGIRSEPPKLAPRVRLPAEVPARIARRRRASPSCSVGEQYPASLMSSRRWCDSSRCTRRRRARSRRAPSALRSRRLDGQGPWALNPATRVRIPSGTPRVHVTHPSPRARARASGSTTPLLGEENTTPNETIPRHVSSPGSARELRARLAAHAQTAGHLTGNEERGGCKSLGWLQTTAPA